MSKHWNPEDELASARASAEGARGRREWPQGATAGLLMLAAACVGTIVLLYQLAGPRDVFVP